MKKANKNKKVIYYTDPLNDDFAGTNIKAKKIDKNYKYIRKNFLWKSCSFILYKVIAYPLVWVFMRFIKGVKIKYENKKEIKKLRSPYFLYGNHTSMLDAFIPALITSSKKNKVIISPDGVSIRGLSNIVQMLGGVPVPNSISGFKNFTTAIDHYYTTGNNITIYPEAHIWPCYTDIRPFENTSFTYPVKLNAPVVAFVTAYTKPKLRLKKVKRTIYVSAPFYVNQNLAIKEAKQDLRDRVYAWMKDTAQKHSSYAHIEYINISEANNNISDAV